MSGSIDFTRSSISVGNEGLIRDQAYLILPVKNKGLGPYIKVFCLDLPLFHVGLNSQLANMVRPSRIDYDVPLRLVSLHLSMRTMDKQLFRFNFS